MSELRLESSKRAGRFASLEELQSQCVSNGYSMYGWVDDRFYQIYPGGRCIDYTETIKRDAKRLEKA